MKQIAVLIPTYHRYKKLEPLVKNLFSCSTEAEAYFVIDPDDQDSRMTLNALSKRYPLHIFMCKGEYVEAVNEVYKITREPFIFCGADDIEFTQGWDKKLLKSIEGYQVTGGVDDWPVSQSGCHTSHPLIRRTYIDETGTSLGHPGFVYNPERKHFHVDIEMEQLAWHRGVIKINRDCIIHHHHWVNKQVEDDDTYKHSRTVIASDTEHYNRTFKDKNYEYWDFPSMFEGKAVENPNKMKRLSVVMPIWNCEDYTRRTLNSLIEKTQHPFELILIDDASTEHNGTELLADLKEIASKKFITVKTVANKSQLYCNANWNKGVELATGDYIAIINSDIDFLTQDWDDFLIENIDLGYELVSPFQKDNVYPGNAYMLPAPPDVCSKMKLRGACYMISPSLAKRAFPISPRYSHWFGDNVIGREARTWMFDIRVEIFHHISKSGAKVDKKVFWTMVKKDAENYQQDFNDPQPEIIHNCEKNLKWI
jgi:glycosyltransferase involved in cell wall biosynthesis